MDLLNMVVMLAGIGLCAATDEDVNRGFCVTWMNSSGTLVTANCPYYIANPICDDPMPIPDPGPEQNERMCRHFKRHGTNCDQCINGTGPAVFSSGLPCAPCSPMRFAVYLLLQLLCVTLLYGVCAFLQLHVASSPLSVYVYYSQIIVNIVVVHSTVYTGIACTVKDSVMKIFLTLYGIWNLDFFRYVVPPTCVSSSYHRNIDVLMFDYIIAFYPILLTVVLYVFIELYYHNYRVVVLLWRPFQNCFSRVRKSNINGRASVINVFASFLLLAYSKLLFTSLSFLYSTNLYVYPNATKINTLLYYDLAVGYFSREHAPYLILPFIVITFFIIFPPFLLLLYPTRMCGRCLERCRFPRQDILQMLMDTFQGWYKDGTEGTWDYRPVSSLYMFLRIGVGVASVLAKAFIPYKMTTSEPLGWIFMGIVHGILGVLFLAVRPYKKLYMNVSDGSILILFSALSILVGRRNLVVQGVAFIFSIFPLLAGVCYFIWKLAKKMVPFRRNIRRRLRRAAGYTTLLEETTQTGIDNIDRVLHPGRYDNPGRNNRDHELIASTHSANAAGQVGQYGATCVSHDQDGSLAARTTV